MLDFPTASPLNAYLAKLERRASLSSEDRESFLSLPVMEQKVEAQTRLVKEGQVAESSIFLIEGLISRQMCLDKSPQIISLSVPGDAVDLQTLFFHRTDHALFAHTPTTIVTVPHAALIDLCRRRPILSQILWHDTLVDSAIFREWAMNVGHRRATDRIAYFLLEIEARLSVIGEAQNGVFRLPLVQHEIASALGLSLVHLNKSLKRLRDAGRIKTQGREFQITDVKALRREIGFDDKYLHLNEPPIFEKTEFSLVS